MTKLKNTKKGMAKKALSISLVAAMLATSNVPVWAAEDLFTDGSGVAVQTQAAEDADVFTSGGTQDQNAAPAAAEVTDNADLLQASAYTVEKNAALTTDHEGDWSGKLKLVAADSTKPGDYTVKDSDGNKVEQVNLEVYYNDSLDINRISGVTADFASINTALQAVTPTKEVYTKGANVAVHVLVGEAEADIISCDLNPVDITGATLVASTVTQEYDGNQAVITGATVTVNSVDAAQADKDIMVNFEKATDGVNVGKYGVYAEGQGAFTGRSAVLDDAVAITPATATKANLSVAVSGEATYNGKATVPSSVVVTDKITGKELPAELYTVATTNVNAGTYSSADTAHPLAVTVTMKKDNGKTGTELVTNNFAMGAVSDTTNEIITGSYTVKALDLTSLSAKYEISVPAKVAADTYKYDWADVVLKDRVTGTVYKGTDIAPEADVDVAAAAAAGASSGIVTVTPKSTTTNVTGKLTFDFRIAKAEKAAKDVRVKKGLQIGSTTTAGTETLEDVAAAIQGVLDAQTYTGSALEPLKDVFTSLVWKDKDAASDDVPLVLGTDYTVAYTNNTDSDDVRTAASAGKAQVTVSFIGKYSGQIVYDMKIAKAAAAVTGEDLAYEAGKTSYDAVVKATTTVDGKEAVIPASNYTVQYLTHATSTVSGSNTATAKVTFTNKNYEVTSASDADGLEKTVTSTLFGKSLKDTSISAQVTGTYVYTGKAINPTIEVKDGAAVLTAGTDYEIISKAGTEAGEATVTIAGIKNYSGQLVLKYTITKADLASAVVDSGKGTGKEKEYDQPYNGQVQGPRIATVKIGDATLQEYAELSKTGDYVVTYDKDAKEVGTYNFTITAAASSTKVLGEIKGTYKITPARIDAQFVKRSNPAYTGNTATQMTPPVNYTGKEITLADLKTKYVLVNNKSEVLTEGKDYRVEYEDNIDAGTATVYAYGLGNYAYVEGGKESSIASANFVISGLKDIVSVDIKAIADAEYAGGLYVEPKVTVKLSDGKTLVQGTDYTVSTEVIKVGSDYAGNLVTVIGKGAYTAGGATNVGVAGAAATKWNVTKKDMKNTTVKVDGEEVTVMNGTVVVPSSEYTVTFSEDGKKVTVTANPKSKNYTGSKEQDTSGEAVGAPVISNVVVTGNSAKVILSGDADNATGYDYVVSTENDYKNGRVAINKNSLMTTTSFQYLQKGVYYAYLHAWKRVDGKKVFGGWSNLYRFEVATTTPDQPVITSVKVTGKTVKVTYSRSANATGYDIVLGSQVKNVNGEKRPVSYGKLVKKVYKGTTVTATFTNVPKGTYYAGLHAYNRTRVDNKKVFSPWSNAKKVTVK